LKKWTAVLLGTILVMGLAACGNDKGAKEEPVTPAAGQEATTSETPPAEDVKEEPKEEATPTADELLEKSVEASQSMKSFAMQADIKQNIVVEGTENAEQNIDMVLDSEVTLEPTEMMQNMTMESPEGKVEMKQYITENGIYMLMDGQWMKIPKESEQEIRSSLDTTASGPKQQIEQFKSIAKDMKVTDEGDKYVLTAEVSGDNLKELATSLMNQAGGDPQTAAMMEQMNIKSINIEYGLQKDTFLPTATNLDMVMEMEAEGQKVTLDMKMKSTYSKHNEVSKIEVPKEALSAE